MKTPETEYRSEHLQRGLCPGQCISDNLSAALQVFCDLLSSPHEPVFLGPLCPGRLTGVLVTCSEAQCSHRATSLCDFAYRCLVLGI